MLFLYTTPEIKKDLERANEPGTFGKHFALAFRHKNPSQTVTREVLKVKLKGAASQTKLWRVLMRYSNREIEVIVDMINSYGHLTYTTWQECHAEYIARTGIKRSSGALYMAAWRIENGLM